MDRLETAPPSATVQAADASPTGAFSDRALLVFGGFFGLVTGILSLLTYTFGIFAGQLGTEYGWSLGDMSLSMSAYALVLFLGSSPIGRIADTLGAGRVAAASMLALGLSLLAFPYLVHDVRSLWLAYALVTVAGIGTTPVVMLKPVVAAFSGQRGTASGVVLCGTGVGAILTPPLVNALIEAGGWRLGYMGLGCIAVAASPVIWLTLARRTAPGAETPAAALASKAGLSGLSFREAVRHREFWILSAIAFLAAQAISAMIAHLIPLLRDLGASAATAAGYASLLGLASLVGRIGSGFALDRLPGFLVGLIFLGSGMLGILLLAAFGAEVSVPAVFLIGVALGSEIDLLAYYVSRYFGLRHHGVIFGWTYGVMSLASILSPYVAGVLRDRQGGYGLAMTLMITSLTAAGGLCLLLGRYRYAVR